MPVYESDFDKNLQIQEVVLTQADIERLNVSGKNIPINTFIFPGIERVISQSEEPEMPESVVEGGDGEGLSSQHFFDLQEILKERKEKVVHSNSEEKGAIRFELHQNGDIAVHKRGIFVLYTWDLDGVRVIESKGIPRSKKGFLVLQDLQREIIDFIKSEQYKKAVAFRKEIFPQEDIDTLTKFLEKNEEYQYLDDTIDRKSVV